MRSLLFFFALALPEAVAFAPPKPNFGRFPLRILRSVVDAEEPAPSESSTSVISPDKEDLLTTIGGGTLGAVSSTNRVIVNELLLKLEASNPTTSPATSTLLNGAWDVVYTGGYSDGLIQSPTRQLALFLYAGGYAPGQFGLQLARLLPESVVSVSNLAVTISRDQPRAESSSTVQVANSKFDVKIKSSLDTESDVRIREVYSGVTVGTTDLDIPDRFQYSRLLYVTYLDEDLLVVRDESGLPEILLRKPKEFLVESTGEPSSADDDLAPGAG